MARTVLVMEKVEQAVHKDCNWRSGRRPSDRTGCKVEAQALADSVRMAHRDSGLYLVQVDCLDKDYTDSDSVLAPKVVHHTLFPDWNLGLMDSDHKDWNSGLGDTGSCFLSPRLRNEKIIACYCEHGVSIA